MLSALSVTHWSIPAKNLDESEVFYSEFLGHEKRGRLGDPGDERAGAFRATAFRVGDEDYIIWETGHDVDPDDWGKGSLHYAFTVSPEVWEEAVGEIHRRDIPLAGPIVYREFGFFLGREIYVYDPAGNVIEFTDPTWRVGMPTPSFEEILGLPTM